MIKNIRESFEISPKAISIATIRNGKPKQFYVEFGSGKCYMVSMNEKKRSYLPSYIVTKTVLEGVCELKAR